MILNIPRLGHPVLRVPAAAVSVKEISALATQRLIDDMIETMREYDGVGIAAVQVRAAKRIAVIEVREAQQRYPAAPTIPLTVLINPRIVEKSKELVEDWEGCLSIPDLRGRVPRHRRLRIAALDRKGKKVAFEAEGFFARILQHECDHLAGRLYLDRMRDLKSLSFLAEWKRFAVDSKSF